MDHIGQTCSVTEEIRSVDGDRLDFIYAQYPITKYSNAVT